MQSCLSLGMVTSSSPGGLVTEQQLLSPDVELLLVRVPSHLPLSLLQVR